MLIINLIFSSIIYINTLTHDTKCGTVIKKGWNKEASYWVQEAYNISNCDKNFVALLEAENGKWDHKRASSLNKDGTRDYGFCQINNYWHKKIVRDKRFFTNPRWQLKKCLELYKGGTIFYGKYKIHKTIKHFNFF